MALVAGSRLGPYEIIAALGRGGMGEVYKAHDPRLGRDVAIKVLSESLTGDPAWLRRFEQEARAVAALSHPNILAVFDVGTGDAPYLVTELLEGDTLRTLLDRNPPPLDQVIDIALQLVSGLAAAHGRGIVHRDLKPANVFLTRNGVVKILDFGLAKSSTRNDADLDATRRADTMAGTVFGTVGYMAPEQIRGEATDPRADIFAVGAMLYELVSGQRAFAGDSGADIMSAVLKEDPPNLALRSGTPAGIARIVRRCLEKDPAKRFQSASDLRLALEQVTATPDVEPHIRKRDEKSIAVLPFVNMSADPENEYFCDGIAEDLISALTKVAELHVAARTSAFSFKGKNAALQDVARTLNVNTVLEGSVRQAGNRLRVTARMTNVADGYQIWSERYDRQLADVFEIQDEISSAIVTALKVTLLGREKAGLVKRPTDNVEAYQLYLKGRHHWHKWNPDGFAKSRECMERALELDPDYTLAYVGLADVYLASGTMGMSAYPELLPKAKAALTRALALDPEMAEAWTLMGVVHFLEWDWTASDRASTRAIELSPRLAHAYTVRALNALYSGRLEATHSPAKRAVDLDPLGLFWNATLIMAYLAHGDYTAAANQTDTLLEIDPNFWWAHYGLGVIAAARGDYAEASRRFQDGVRYSAAAPYAVGLFGFALGLAGDRDRAKQELAGLMARTSQGYVPALGPALAYVGVGSTDQAFEWLDRSFEERDIYLLFEVLYLPHLEGLRNDPRMLDLRRRIAACGVRLPT